MTRVVGRRGRVHPVGHAAEHVGLSATGGSGFLLWHTNGPAVNVAARASYYPFRAFSGLQLGVEADYAHAWRTMDGMSDTASYSALGGYVGYKWLLASGLTVHVEASAAYFDASASRQFIVDALFASHSGIRPIFDAGVGYSF